MIGYKEDPKTPTGETPTDNTPIIEKVPTADDDDDDDSSKSNTMLKDDANTIKSPKTGDNHWIKLFK